MGYRTASEIFGDGSDGSLIYVPGAGHNRWEDGRGNAAASVPGKYDVVGGLLRLLGHVNFVNLTNDLGGTIQFGRDATEDMVLCCVRGLFWNKVGGIVEGQDGCMARALGASSVGAPMAGFAGNGEYGGHAA